MNSRNSVSDTVLVARDAIAQRQPEVEMFNKVFRESLQMFVADREMKLKKAKHPIVIAELEKELKWCIQELAEYEVLDAVRFHGGFDYGDDHGFS